MSLTDKYKQKLEQGSTQETTEKKKTTGKKESSLNDRYKARQEGTPTETKEETGKGVSLSDKYKHSMTGEKMEKEDVDKAKFPEHLGGGEYLMSEGEGYPKQERAYAGLETKRGHERDHIVPVSLGGTSGSYNLQYLESPHGHQYGDPGRQEGKVDVEKEAIEQFRDGQISREQAILKIQHKQQKIQGLIPEQGWENYVMEGYKDAWGEVKDFPSTAVSWVKDQIPLLNPPDKEKVREKYNLDKVDELKEKYKDAEGPVNIQEEVRADVDTEVKKPKDFNNVDEFTKYGEDLYNKYDKMVKEKGAMINSLYPSASVKMEDTDKKLESKWFTFKEENPEVANYFEKKNQAEATEDVTMNLSAPARWTAGYLSKFLLETGFEIEAEATNADTLKGKLKRTFRTLSGEEPEEPRDTADIEAELKAPEEPKEDLKGQKVVEEAKNENFEYEEVLEQAQSQGIPKETVDWVYKGEIPEYEREPFEAELPENVITDLLYPGDNVTELSNSEELEGLILDGTKDIIGEDNAFMLTMVTGAFLNNPFMGGSNGLLKGGGKKATKSGMKKILGKNLKRTAPETTEKSSDFLKLLKGDKGAKVGKTLDIPKAKKKATKYVDDVVNDTVKKNPKMVEELFGVKASREFVNSNSVKSLLDNPTLKNANINTDAWGSIIKNMDESAKKTPRLGDKTYDIARKSVTTDDLAKSHTKIYKADSPIDRTARTIKGVSTSKNKTTAKKWAKEKPARLSEYFISPDATVYKPSKVSKDMSYGNKQQMIDDAKKQGYDVLDLSAKGDGEQVILNPDVVRSKGEVKEALQMAQDGKKLTNDVVDRAVEKSIAENPEYFLRDANGIATLDPGITKKIKQKPELTPPWVAMKTAKDGRRIPAIGDDGVFAWKAHETHAYKDVGGSTDNLLSFGTTADNVDVTQTRAFGPMTEDVAFRVFQKDNQKMDFVSHYVGRVSEILRGEGFYKKPFKGLSKKDGKRMTALLRGKNATKAEKQLAKQATDKEKVAVKKIRKVLKEMNDQVNQTRMAMGKERIPFRPDLMTDMEKSSGWFRAIKDKVKGVNKEHLDFMHPNTKTGKELMESATEYREDNLFKVLDNYINSAGHEVHVAPTTAYLREVSGVLDSRGMKRASKWLSEYADENLLGKISKADDLAGLEPQRLRTRVFKTIQQSRVLGGLGANIRWMLFTMPASISNTVMKTGWQNTLRGGAKWFMSGARRAEIKKLPSYRAKTGLSVGRTGMGDLEQMSRTLYKSKIDNFNDFINIIPGIIEKHMTGMSMSAGMEQATRYGMGTKTKRLFSDYVGQVTQSMYDRTHRTKMMNSLFLRTVSPFQTFTFEMFRHAKNLTVGGGGIPLRAKQKMIQATNLMVATWMVNEVHEKMFGKPLTTPGTFTPMVGGVTDKWYENFKNMTTDEKQRYSHPRRPAPPVEDVDRMQEAINDIMEHDNWNGLRSELIYWTMGMKGVGGAGQVNRTIDGIMALEEGEQRDVTGDKMFDIETEPDKVRAVLFGPYGTEASREHYEPTDDIDKIDERLEDAWEYEQEMEDTESAESAWEGVE